MNESSAQWFSIQSSEDFHALEKRVESNFQQLVQLQKQVTECTEHITQLQNDNLKLVNRILEAEIAVERYKNLLLRKNISFPFSPMMTAKYMGHL